MKNKVLVLGATGLIGHQVFNHLKFNGKYDLYTFFRKKLQNDSIILDARNEEKYLQKIRDKRQTLLLIALVY